jgi:membrane associated rhomboid family serine protease
MLSDRHYMRDTPGSYRPTGLPVMGWLISILVAGFVLQNIFLRWFNAGYFFDNAFALSRTGLSSGKVWQLFTYSILHDPRNLLHLLANLLAIYFLGRELLPLLGDRRFIWVFLSSVFAGGVLWAVTNWSAGGYLMGASAGACALLIIYASFFPNRPVTFLLFFILPVTLKPKHVAWTVLLLDLGGFIFYEILGAVSPFGVAHSAHLGGMLAGWVYFRYVHESAWSLPWRSLRRVAAPRTARGPVGHIATAGPPQPPSHSELKAEVDRILDKINSDGFGALSAEEKRLLDNARDMLSRR